MNIARAIILRYEQEIERKKAELIIEKARIEYERHKLEQIITEANLRLELHEMNNKKREDAVMTLCKTILIICCLFLITRYIKGA